jgi:tetratricopeptide (TPR) repeat protein
MLLRLSHRASRLGLPALAILLCAGLTYFSVRTAWAAHESGLGTLSGFQAAARLESSNAENWYLLGRYWQYTMDEPDAQRAIHYYRAALSLDPRDADTWTELAAAYESEGDIQRAREAFREAKRAYPLSAEVSWRYGNFLLRQDQITDAFAEIRRAAYVDPKRSAEAFSRCWRVDPDVRAILDHVLPPNLDGYLDVIHQLADKDEYPAALVVWERLVAFHPPLTLFQAIPFTEQLAQKHEIEDARRVWDDALRLSGTVSPTQPPGSVLWDGGFETGWSNGGFAWHFPTTYGSVRISFDSREKHSGRQSLKISFDGRHNVGLDGPCIHAEVQPGVSYRLHAWVRAENLTTNEGVRFHLDWRESARNGNLETPDVRGSQPWTEITLPWTAPSGVRQVRVCIVRHPSEKFDNQIQGTAWIDDVALVPENSKP